MPDQAEREFPRRVRRQRLRQQPTPPAENPQRRLLLKGVAGVALLTATTAIGTHLSSHPEQTHGISPYKDWGDYKNKISP